MTTTVDIEKRLAAIEARSAAREAKSRELREKQNALENMFHTLDVLFKDNWFRNFDDEKKFIHSQLYGIKSIDREFIAVTETLKRNIETAQANESNLRVGNEEFLLDPGDNSVSAIYDHVVDEIIYFMRPLKLDAVSSILPAYKLSMGSRPESISLFNYTMSYLIKIIRGAFDKARAFSKITGYIDHNTLFAGNIQVFFPDVRQNFIRNNLAVLMHHPEYEDIQSSISLDGKSLNLKLIAGVFSASTNSIIDIMLTGSSAVAHKNLMIEIITILQNNIIPDNIIQGKFDRR